MANQAHGASWHSAVMKGLTAAGIAGGAIFVGNSPILVTAAETPAEIRQAERKDPAAGEIVIINRKAEKTTAIAPKAEKSAAKTGEDAAPPDPYAPVKRDRTRKAAPENARPAASRTKEAERPSEPPRSAAAKRQNVERTPQRAPKKTASEAKTETVNRRERDDRVQSRARDEQLSPPPPIANTDIRPRRTVRSPADDAWTRPAPEPPRRSLSQRRFDDDEDQRYRPRRRYSERDRDDALHPPPGYRPRGRDWRYAERSPRWRDNEDLRYRSVRRPWRVCRRLAWRCRDGFERACWRWRQQCQ